MHRLSVTILLSLALYLVIPQDALACAVCGAGEENTRWAFIFTTALMTFTPLLAMGAIGGFIYSKVKPQPNAPRQEAFMDGATPERLSS